MQLTDIDNLPIDELKQRRHDLARDLVEHVDKEELADRYIRTLIDAKTRDRKMSEQGKYITQLEVRVGELENLHK
jgi:polyhydroxyalkanoate synthesis regulator phasin